jgi:hypothetical protein
VENPFGKGVDPYGNPMYLGLVAWRLVQVVVADDDPDYVITVYREDRG